MERSNEIRVDRLVETIEDNCNNALIFFDDGDEILFVTKEIIDEINNTFKCNLKFEPCKIIDENKEIHKYCKFIDLDYQGIGKEIIQKLKINPLEFMGKFKNIRIIE